MNSYEHSYEMPLETEESYLKKIESGKLIKEELIDDNWIPDIYIEA